VRKIYAPRDHVKTSAKSPIPAAFKKIEDKLASQFNTRVRMSHTKAGKGSITLEYYSLEELNQLLEKLNIEVS